MLHWFQNVYILIDYYHYYVTLVTGQLWGFYSDKVKSVQKLSMILINEKYRGLR